MPRLSMRHFGRGLLGERPTLAMAVLPGAIAVNLGISYLVNLLKLPFFGDSWGTFAMGALFGPAVGALAGVASNLVGGMLVNPAMPWYVGTAAFVGAFAGWAMRWGWLRSPLRAGLAGLFCGVSTAVISAPVTAYLFGGVSAAGAFSYIVAIAVKSGENILNATIFAGLVSDPADKAITAVLIAIVLAALPRRHRGRFPEVARLQAGQQSAPSVSTAAKIAADA
jgi:energy-coupling factor transport system substrate-specific component